MQSLTHNYYYNANYDTLYLLAVSITRTYLDDVIKWVLALIVSTV